jgi:hypothetical protein
MASLGKGERPPLCLNHEFRKEDSVDARGLEKRLPRLTGITTLGARDALHLLDERTVVRSPSEWETNSGHNSLRTQKPPSP